MSPRSSPPPEAGARPRLLGATLAGGLARRIGADQALAMLDGPSLIDRARDALAPPGDDIVICGHSDCGAMTAIATCKCLDHMPAVSSWLRYADSARVVNEARQHADQPTKVASMVRENVIAQLANIQTHPSVRLALEEGRVTLHGWIYDIESGRIDAFDSRSGTFMPLADNPDIQAVSPQTRRVA